MPTGGADGELIGAGAAEEEKEALYIGCRDGGAVGDCKAWHDNGEGRWRGLWRFRCGGVTMGL